ncbi:hypothetical protein Scep_028154 [Stephania cephalantha]|uniref:Uncharacterized protein n=1 Tax=Stephania cephalantha TaxID=152367 RepID=A0AAP0EE02_9MAGN
MHSTRKGMRMMCRVASTRKGYETIRHGTSGATKLCLRRPTAPPRIAWTSS